MQLSDTKICTTLYLQSNMASKRKELTHSQRAQIIGAWKVGSSLRNIAQTFDHPYTTVQKVVKTYKDHGLIKPSPRKGRQKIMSERNKRALLRIVKKDRKLMLPGRILNLLHATLKLFVDFLPCIFK